MTKPNIDELMKKYEWLRQNHYERTDDIIEIVCYALAEKWKENKSQRLGQLLMNLMRDNDHNQGLNSLWNMLDEDWIEILDR